MISLTVWLPDPMFRPGGFLSRGSLSNREGGLCSGQGGIHLTEILSCFPLFVNFAFKLFHG